MPGHTPGRPLSGNAEPRLATGSLSPGTAVLPVEGGEGEGRVKGGGRGRGIRHRLYSQWVGLVRPPLTTAFRPLCKTVSANPYFHSTTFHPPH